MKPELTLELKKRFYAQYYGQKVMADKQMPDKTFDVDLTYAERERSYLKLRSVSKITDEEAIEVAKIILPRFDVSSVERGDEVGVWLGDHRVSIYNDSSGFCLEYREHPKQIESCYITMNIFNELHAYQYLQSIGVITDFMGYSVEELVNAGWVRLIES